jgi:hypothetical protein
MTYDFARADMGRPVRAFNVTVSDIRETLQSCRARSILIFLQVRFLLLTSPDVAGWASFFSEVDRLTASGFSRFQYDMTFQCVSLHIEVDKSIAFVDHL